MHFFVRQEIIDKPMLDLFPNLKVVQRYGVGVDNVNVEYANKRGIAVCNTPQYGQQNEVSNHAVALYLALSRRLLTRDEMSEQACGISAKPSQLPAVVTRLWG